MKRTEADQNHLKVDLVDICYVKGGVNYAKVMMELRKDSHKTFEEKHGFKDIYVITTLITEN